MDWANRLFRFPPPRIGFAGIAFVAFGKTSGGRSASAEAGRSALRTLAPFASFSARPIAAGEVL